MAKSRNGLTVERAHLVAALSTVARVIESRNTYPILANVHLSVAGDRLTVRGTDLDIEITTSIPATGTLPTTTAPAKTLLDIAKKFPAGAEIALNLDDQTLIVKSGKSRFKLGVLPAEGFPELKSDDFGDAFALDLEALFEPVRFAISNEETRFWLCGIYLLGANDQLTAVATDGHRLAKHVLPGDWPEFKGIIVPAKTVGVVPSGQVKVAAGSTKIRIEHGDTVIISKLIEGTYPDYERVIPRNNELALTADRAALLASTDRVATVASDRSGGVIKLTMEPGVVALTVRGDTDSASDEVAVDYSGPPVESGVSARYLREMLSAVSGSSVQLAFGEALGPILVQGENDSWTGVQMPMRAA